jgi:hypothetical protein
MLEKGAAAAPMMPERRSSHVLRVGCALLPKKVSCVQTARAACPFACVAGCSRHPNHIYIQVTRYLTPKMMETAAMYGILLQQVDYTKSLLTQGTFDVIIHKLRPNPGVHLLCSFN